MVAMAPRVPFTPLVGKEWLDRPIATADLQKPGLVLTGLFDYFHPERLQVIGRSEVRFLAEGGAEALGQALRLCDPRVPAILVVSSQEIPPAFLERAAQNQIPVLSTPRPAAEVMGAVTVFLSSRLAPKVQIHGTLVDLFGVGLLLVGDSGVGKSESALELVTRGHQLVADDAVEIRLHQERLTGTSPELSRYLMEVRGIGIINMRDMFGIGAIREEKIIDQVVRLFRAESRSSCDRLGTEVHNWEILGQMLPLLEIPVAPGRNLAVLLEIAARRHLLKAQGRDASRELQAALARRIAPRVGEE